MTCPLGAKTLPEEIMRNVNDNDNDNEKVFIAK